MLLTQYIGDSKTHNLALEWADAAFTPGENWALILTAKRKATDADADAVFQKASGAGITVSGSTASVKIVPEDSADLTATVSLLIDIQAQHVSTGEIRTVCYGRIKFVRDITRLTETSVPVNTTEEPVPFAPALTAANIIAALGVPTYASLALANANLTLGQIFWNTTTLKLEIATA